MFNPKEFVENAIREIKSTVGNGKVIGACSGGVDSTVSAVIAKKAIGNNLIPVFIDTGYMRKNEPEKKRRMLEKLGLNLRFIDAKHEFYNSLKNVVDPEEKRKIIGENFIKIFERIAKEENARFLMQGTIAPDWIESGGGLRDRIKSHHNVGGLPKDMKLKLIEPLKDIYKDEVRKVAKLLNLKVKETQPFPGPGLAIRITGRATPERTEIIRKASAIVEEEIEKAVMEKRIEAPWQYFAVLLPVRTVGVHGDLRRYGYTVAIRSVESIDGMTASYSKIPHDVLERISIRITNSLGEKINRVVYDITNKPPGTIEWE